jgi:hypothetical protein
MRTQQSAKNNTNRGICEVISHNAKSARRDLSERRVAEPELLNQESIVTEQGGSVLCTRKRSDWVSLGIGAVRLLDGLVRGGMHIRRFL